jgi:CRISPR/Cas system-associated protein endoribonuclease Cas2
LAGFQCRKYISQFRKDFSYLLPDNEEFVDAVEQMFVKNNITYTKEFKDIVRTEIRKAGPEVSDSEIIEGIKKQFKSLEYLNGSTTIFQTTEIEESSPIVYQDESGDSYVIIELNEVILLISLSFK